ncbi:phosphatidate cytidylyltransferase [Sulfurovum sp.]|jgi:phosphatidate cytidylyltransferase|uniref:phosphatidate cytidylyltransferase n=1 Tax=Sulfurovum sp. TaxID=1969726 RepID=UPI002A369EA2|nr:phosphatidate cytidylyltransferase [Sulfurovum sp.]MDY0402658.1 phosphatidate cytidylyltransferase [Sulfurovum sp.]
MIQNLSEFQQRLITGVGLIALVLVIGLIDSFTLTWAFLGMVYIIAFFEAMRLFGLRSNSAFFWAAFIWIVAYFYPNPDDLFFFVAVVFGASIAYFHNFDKRLLLPFLYPVSGMLFILMLYRDFGIMTMFWLVVTVTLTDTGAYFTGKKFGKTKFSDTSPNKTLEGVFGGIFLATVIGSLIGTLVVPFWIAVVVTLITSVASVFGDLFESYLKREAGVKDSGDILPGHGGVLDRIDGYLFGAVMMLISMRALI